MYVIPHLVLSSVWVVGKREREREGGKGGGGGGGGRGGIREEKGAARRAEFKGHEQQGLNIAELTGSSLFLNIASEPPSSSSG